MTLQYKYESDGDIEVLKIEGGAFFSRIGCDIEIECDHIDFYDMLEILDKCRSKQTEIMRPCADFPE